MARRTTSGAVVEVTLELHNYASLDDFLDQTNWRKAITSDQYRTDEVLVPVKMRLGDLGIEQVYRRGYNSFSNGGNSWTEYEFNDTFGLTRREYINTDVFEDMPYTVWLMGAKDTRRIWCGEIFKTEADAQAWIDEHNTLSME